MTARGKTNGGERALDAPRVSAACGGRAVGGVGEEAGVGGHVGYRCGVAMAGQGELRQDGGHDGPERAGRAGAAGATGAMAGVVILMVLMVLMVMMGWRVSHASHAR